MLPAWVWRRLRSGIPLQLVVIEDQEEFIQKLPQSKWPSASASRYRSTF